MMAVKKAAAKKVEEKEALRYNTGKPQLSYLLHYPKAMEALVRVLEQGAVKYEPLNWKLGNKPDEEYLDAALRHLFSHVNDGPYDDDIGVVSVAQAVWNLVTWIELNSDGIETIDPEFNQDEFVARYS